MAPSPPPTSDPPVHPATAGEPQPVSSPRATANTSLPLGSAGVTSSHDAIRRRATLTRQSQRRHHRLSAPVPGGASQLAVLAGGEAVASPVAGPGSDALAGHGGAVEVVFLEAGAAAAAGTVQTSPGHCQGGSKARDGG